MPLIVVTRATSHADMHVLNETLEENNEPMSVMAETSHVPIAGEHAPTGEAAMHAFTAATRAAFVVYTGRGGGGGANGGGGGDGGDGGDDGGDGAVHTDPLDPSNTL